MPSHVIKRYDQWELLFESGRDFGPIRYLLTAKMRPHAIQRAYGTSVTRGKLYGRPTGTIQLFNASDQVLDADQNC